MSDVRTSPSGDEKGVRTHLPDRPFGCFARMSCRVGPSESKMWRIAENKPSAGPPECGDGRAQRASNPSGPDADVRETVSDSGGPWLGPFGSDPRDALALAHLQLVCRTGLVLIPFSFHGGCLRTTPICAGSSSAQPMENITWSRLLHDRARRNAGCASAKPTFFSLPAGLSGID